LNFKITGSKGPTLNDILNNKMAMTGKVDLPGMGLPFPRPAQLTVSYNSLLAYN
jgi:hypothetical protein